MADLRCDPEMTSGVECIHCGRTQGARVCDACFFSLPCDVEFSRGTFTVQCERLVGHMQPHMCREEIEALLAEEKRRK